MIDQLKRSHPSSTWYYNSHCQLDYLSLCIRSILNYMIPCKAGRTYLNFTLNVIFTKITGSKSRLPAIYRPQSLRLCWLMIKYAKLVTPFFNSSRIDANVLFLYRHVKNLTWITIVNQLPHSDSERNNNKLLKKYIYSVKHNNHIEEWRKKFFYIHIFLLYLNK